MKTTVIKKIFITCASVISKPVYAFAALASILGVVLFVLKDSWAIYVALGYFCVLITIFAAYLIFALFRMLETRICDHENRYTYVKYENIDGNQIIYETYKLIQCKKTIMNEFEYNFKWTGVLLYPKFSLICKPLEI
ncbi:hypothetical protein FACS189434_12580 [Bacteroidia bacterium]|nr:hypothetical protein FACS189434_12580 [Bacteroidia bacterium]